MLEHLLEHDTTDLLPMGMHLVTTTTIAKTSSPGHAPVPGDQHQLLYSTPRLVIKFSLAGAARGLQDAFAKVLGPC
jgi:hypothetical protein